MGFGRNSFLGWAQEGTWGIPVAPSKYAELAGDDVKAIRQREPRQTFRGMDAREGAMHDALFGGTGGPTILLNYVGLLRLFEHLFGDASAATANPDPAVRWTHTFTAKDGLMAGKGLTLHLNTDTDAGALPQKRLAGFKMNRGIFSYAPDKPAMFKMEGAGKELDKVAVSTPTFPPITEYVEGFQTTMEIDDIVRQFDSCELTHDNGMDLGKRVMGSKFIAEPVRGNEIAARSITGRIELDAVEADLTKMLGGTLFKLEILAQGAALGTGFYRMEHTFLKCLLLDDPYPVNGPGIVKSTLAFRALLPTSGELASLVVHNNESAVA